MSRRVLITGTGVISTLGNSPAALFRAWCDGASGVRPISQPWTSRGDCSLGAELRGFRAEEYLTGKTLRPLDRVSQIAAAACGLALADSGWDSDSRQRWDVSLVLGTMFGGMHTIAEFDRTAMTSGPSSVSPMMFANTVISAAAGQCAIWHNLRGRNTTISASSTSGICAIAHAFDLIHSGNADVVVAGGVDELSFESYQGFVDAGLLCTNHISPECPIPFERRRNGFAQGEGAAFLVLEAFDFAGARGARTVGEILGHGTAFDVMQGHDPEIGASTMAKAMRFAMQRSGLSWDEVGFLSASANGSVATDRYELGAIEMTFPNRVHKLPITAIKSCVGEALGASGPIQAIGAIESLRQGKLPGIPGLDQLDDGFSVGNICSSTREISAQTALINGIGINGNCCSLVLSVGWA